MAGERLPKTPLLLAVLAVGASSLSSIAADTIFVSAFSLGDLSRFVGISAVVRVASSFAYAAIADRMLGANPDPRKAARLDSAVLIAAALAFALSATFAHSSDKRILYAVCLAQLVLPPLLPLVAFNATTSTLRARHAKRVLPLVAGAATLGSILVGAAATLIAKTAGVAAILALGAILAAFAAPLALRLAAEADPNASERDRVSRAPEGAPRGGAFATLSAAIGDIGKIPAVRVVVAFGFFGALATSFVDYSFKASLKEAYSREDMAAALGIFGVVSNSLVLGLQLLVTGPLVARLGVGRTLALGPFLLGAAGLSAFALPPVIGTGLARVAEIIVRYGVGNSVADVIIVPLERAARMRAKVLVKGAASPLGALAAGGILAAFGEAGPPRAVQLGLLTVACALVILFVRRAPFAYAQALAGALARGRAPIDISPEAAVIFRSSVRQQLEAAVQARRYDDVRRTLDLMTERFFDLSDIRPALAADDAETRRFAITVAARLAGRGDALLAFVPPDREARIEALLLSAARERGALADDARIATAIQSGERGADDEHVADLWAEAQLHDALVGVRMREGGDKAGQARLDRALKQLRKAAKDATAHRQRAALSAIGTLGDRRAEREVLTAMASTDVRVFRESARAAILLDASGAVAGLVARLVAGPHAGTAARALALAGPRAVRELIHALPVSRGEGAIAPTAIADGRTISGTVRAARALARIGESASREVLPMFGELGHRARTSVARAFGAKRLRAGAAERALVESAIDKLVGYGNVLLRSRPHATGALLHHELLRRIDDTVAGIFDLASSLGERAAVQRARFAAIENVGRDNALELVETLLPAPLGANASAFVALATEASPPKQQAEAAVGPAPTLDGWLEKCRKYDAREIPLSDPMLGVLDKVLVLRDVPLFRELSGEELYPVAEIASIEAIDAGVAIVKQGDPSDDLYVVLEGSLNVVKDGSQVGNLGPGKTFGELGVLDGEPRAATVEAESACRLLRIPRAELEALLDESPEVARGIIRTLLSYVRNKDTAVTSARK